MSLLSNIVSPLNTYFELTISEPCKTLKQVSREKHVFAFQPKRFSLLNLLRKQREDAAVQQDGRQPLVKVASVKEHYYRDWD